MAADKGKPFNFSLPVSVVVLAIAYIYVSTVFVFIDRWLGLFSSPGIMNATVFTALSAVCGITYRAAITTDPGRVPATYIPDVEDAESPIHEIKRKGGDLRYCQKCSHYKPPRAHHCRVCKRCVLRMVLLVGSLAYDGIQDEEKIGKSSFRTVYVVSGLLLVPLSITLCMLFGWHIYLVLHNKTTIEYHEGVRALWLAEKGGSIYKHPYDLGPYENLTSVLGPNILRWLWPSANHIGSGLRFNTIYDLPKVQYKVAFLDDNDPQLLKCRWSRAACCI
ncbi:protein S-acyltransferase [Vigna angularis]|uniref:S-acyltransferase n=1 Tax=Phaseolus angularis TaxID=3914 RepID=A0A8T0JT01_PHAAN|nr:protein S-acyltransferase [Vigna angularis]